MKAFQFLVFIACNQFFLLLECVHMKRTLHHTAIKKDTLLKHTPAQVYITDSVLQCASKCYMVETIVVFNVKEEEAKKYQCRCYHEYSEEKLKRSNGWILYIPDHVCISEL